MSFAISQIDMRINYSILLIHGLSMNFIYFLFFIRRCVLFLFPFFYVSFEFERCADISSDCCSEKRIQKRGNNRDIARRETLKRFENVFCWDQCDDNLPQADRFFRVRRVFFHSSLRKISDFLHARLRLDACDSWMEKGDAERCSRRDYSHRLVTAYAYAISHDTKMCCRILFFIYLPFIYCCIVPIEVPMKIPSEIRGVSVILVLYFFLIFSASCFRKFIIVL